jgi:murein DD-endopeptidase MepM/ murein hydrolase activator NlpD
MADPRETPESSPEQNPAAQGAVQPAPSAAGKAKDAAGNAAAAAAVSVVKAIVTRNAGEAVKGVGASAAKTAATGAAASAAKGAVTDAAKTAAGDATKKVASDATKSVAEDAAKNLFSNVKQDATKTGVGRAKDIASSVAEGDAKGTAGKVLSAATPDSEDNSIKGSVQNTVKGAIGGAAGGAIAGGVGAIPGAIIGAASGALANKRGRALLIAAIAALLVIPAMVAVLWFGSFVIVSSSLVSGMQSASAESVKSSGFTDEEVSEAIRLGGVTLAPWQMTKAIQEESGEPIDAELLNSAMREVNSSLDGFEMGDGAGYMPGQNWRTIGEDDRSKEAAAAVKANWIRVLEKYKAEHELDPEKTYKLALMWYLGEKLDECTPAGPMPELVGQTFKMSDGSERKLTDVQIKNAAAIMSEAQKVEGINETAITIMFMAALVESGLKNYANKTIPESLTYPHDAVGQDHDSVGFWQMRRHWAKPYGDMSKLMSVEYQVKAILGGPNGPNYPSPRGIFDIKDWETRPKGDVAQAVEVSAFPDKYAKQEELATQLVKFFTGGGSFGSCGGGVVTGDFAHPLGDGTKYGISSMFGPRDSICNASGCASSFHKGTDFGASCGTPLYAVADGTVTRTGINGGWGNVVEYDLADGTKLRYAHQPYGTTWPGVGSTVKAGQEIGKVGQTGVSQGCHLHFEVIVGGAQIDAFTWMKERNIPLTFQSKNVKGYVPGTPTLW